MDLCVWLACKIYTFFTDILFYSFCKNLLVFVVHIKLIRTIWLFCFPALFSNISHYAKLNSPTQYIGRFHFRYVRLYDVDIPKEKLLSYLQTVDPDQTPHSASDLGQHCLLVTHFRVSCLQWVNSWTTMLYQQNIYTLYSEQELSADSIAHLELEWYWSVMVLFRISLIWVCTVCLGLSVLILESLQ